MDIDLYINDAINTICNAITEPARYEQLAEECCELAQASLKKARKLRNDNYTPKTMEEIDDNLIEEFTDVLLSAQSCGIKDNKNIMRIKLNRWIRRIDQCD